MGIEEAAAAASLCTWISPPHVNKIQAIKGIIDPEIVAREEANLPEYTEKLKGVVSKNYGTNGDNGCDFVDSSRLTAVSDLRVDGVHYVDCSGKAWAQRVAAKFSEAAGAVAGKPADKTADVVAVATPAAQ